MKKTNQKKTKIVGTTLLGCLIGVLLFLSASLPAQAASLIPFCYAFGDVTDDGLITNADVVRIADHVSGINPLSGMMLWRADVNASGFPSAPDVDLHDQVLVLQYVFNMLPDPYFLACATVFDEQLCSPSGDVFRIGTNADKVSFADALYILEYNAGLVDSIDLESGDVGGHNHPATVNAVDASLIMQYAAGFISNFSVANNSRGCYECGGASCNLKNDILDGATGYTASNCDNACVADATLTVRANVDGSLTTGVSIPWTGWGTNITSAPGYSTTQYTFTSSSNIDTRVQAPATYGSADFVDWTGCDGWDPVNRKCGASPAGGEIQTVTANYTTPPPPNTLTVRANVDGSLTTGVSIPWWTQWGEDITGAPGHPLTEYTYTSSSGFETRVEAEATYAGANFVSWTGCFWVDGRHCRTPFANSGGAAVIVTANYTTPPIDNTLTVTSTTDGASDPGVVIERVAGTAGTNGTTDYTFTSSSDISTTLRVPSSENPRPDGDTFYQWIGCASTPGSVWAGAITGNECVISVSGGSTWTVTADYLSPGNNSPIAEAGISLDGVNYSSNITVTQGQSVSVWLSADQDVTGDGFASRDPDGWTDPTNGVSSGGRCELNTDLDQNFPPDFEAVDTVFNPLSATNCNIDLGSKTFNDLFGTYTYYVLQITDNLGAVSNIASVSVTVEASANQAPYIESQIIEYESYCGIGPGDGAVGFRWTYKNDDGDLETRFDLRVNDFDDPNQDGPGGAEVDRTVNGDLSNPDGTVNTQYVSVEDVLSGDNIIYNDIYYWWVRVWDDQGGNSGWIAGPNFTTALHAYPWPNFTCDGVDNCSTVPVLPGVIVTLADTPTFYGGAALLSLLWDLTASSGVLEPGFSDTVSPIDVKFSTGTNQQVSLQVTDTSGFFCSTTENLNVSGSLPEWKEIAPIGLLERFLASIFQFSRV